MMSEQLYRLISVEGDGGMLQQTEGHLYYEGFVVPVERCEHDMTDPHNFWVEGPMARIKGWCPGSPTLAVSDE